ncbi:glycosyltransferase family 2 protein [Paenibacillus montanisoli]|nr:glycosyltransferase family A protein [Paenibacillus montanisoli]
MSGDPLISVVIPCYNYGEYLEETIDSVLNSTFQDVEIIVVDDGSDDPGTVHLLSSLDKPKTTVIKQSNKGVAAARNKGFTEAKGKYILPLDADDLIHPTYLEKAFWIMELFPRVGFVSPQVKAFGTENWVHDAPQYNFHKLLFHNIACGTSLLRKEAFVQAGGYKSGFVVMGYEDWDFWITVGEKGWYGYSIFERLFLYRRHGRSMVHEAIDHHEQLVGQIKARHPLLYQEDYLNQLKQRWENNSPLKDMSPRIQNGSDWQNYTSKQTTPNKPRWLLLMPQTNRERLSPRCLNFVDGLHSDFYVVTMVGTEYVTGSDIDEFSWLTSDIFNLPLYVPKIELKLDIMERLISKLIATRGIDRIFLLGSRQGHYLRPYIQNGFPHIPIEIIE